MTPQQLNWEESLLHEAPDKELAQQVLRAIKVLFDSDGALLLNNVHERTVTARFACHLKQELPEWDVDCEYNREGHEVKRVDGSVVCPDIIVHHRNTTDNLLVIEVKKSNTQEADTEDIDRLQKFCIGYLQYKYGLFLKFVVGDDAPGLARHQWVSAKSNPTD